jgi:hypothetical protein
MRENRIKRKLQEGQPVTVVSGHANADMIDFLGQFGFDGIWLEVSTGRSVGSRSVICHAPVICGA